MGELNFQKYCSKFSADAKTYNTMGPNIFKVIHWCKSLKPRSLHIVNCDIC